MQDAYIAEQGNAVGNFTTIGYTVPGGTSGADKGETTNFTYEQIGSYLDGSIVDASEELVWQATNKAKLNDCAGDANWALQVTVTNADGAEWKTKELTDVCKALTPNFDKIGSGTFSGS
ncbi:MAG: hypothetical protein UHD64_05570 [Bacteroidales bacterium]|nr:hypothetical protein [Bacteroidales bacterium]